MSVHTTCIFYSRHWCPGLPHPDPPQHCPCRPLPGLPLLSRAPQHFLPLSDTNSALQGPWGAVRLFFEFTRQLPRLLDSVTTHPSKSFLFFLTLPGPRLPSPRCPGTHPPAAHLIHPDPFTPASRGWLACLSPPSSSDPACRPRRSGPSPLLGHSPQCVSYFGDAIQVPAAGHAAPTGSSNRHRRHLFPRLVHAGIP